MDNRSTTPKGDNAVLGGKKMSSALKERLKRCGRSYTSPVSRPATCTPSAFSSPSNSSSSCQKPGWSLKNRSTLDDSITECLPLSGDTTDSRNASYTADSENARSDKPRDLASDPNLFENDRENVTDLGKEADSTRLGDLENNPLLSPLVCQGQLTHWYPSEKQGGMNISKESAPYHVMPSLSVSDDGNRQYDGDRSLSSLKEERDRLKFIIKEKEEKLRKLNMVKLYRTKNELGHLQTLIDKWRSVTQESVQELHTLTSDPQPSLTELIDFLHLDHKFIGYNAETESFT